MEYLNDLKNCEIIDGYLELVFINDQDGVKHEDTNKLVAFYSSTFVEVFLIDGVVLQLSEIWKFFQVNNNEQKHKDNNSNEVIAYILRSIVEGLTMFDENNFSCERFLSLF